MSGYRDDHEAALRRAAALERQLAQAKNELADKDRQLEEKTRKLAESRAELERTPEPAPEKPMAASAARARLEALRAKGARPRVTPYEDSNRPAIDIALGESPGASRRRILTAMVWHGELLVSWTPLAMLVLMLPMSLYFFAIIVHKLEPPMWVYVVGTVTPWLVVFGLPLLYLPFKYRYMMKWEKSLPYDLLGYPEILGSEPPKRDESTLTVRLDFAGVSPADLDAIMRGFDPDVTVRGRRLSRPWPIRETHSKSGYRRDNSATNYPVHKWVRRFEREVLRPLHTAHGVTRVVFDRRG